jgi:hypothetical protein
VGADIARESREILGVVVDDEDGSIRRSTHGFMVALRGIAFAVAG